MRLTNFALFVGSAIDRGVGGNSHPAVGRSHRGTASGWQPDLGVATPERYRRESFPASCQPAGGICRNSEVLPQLFLDQTAKLRPCRRREVLGQLLMSMEA